jgi:hypothetical protein
MEQKVEREWKEFLCPERKEKSVVMSEWDILSEKGQILKKTRRQMDCHNPRLAEFGGPDCRWTCDEAAVSEQTARPGREWLLVCTMLAGAFFWIIFYGMVIKPHLHFYGLILFFGFPFFIGLMLNTIWKMTRHIGIFKRKEVLS